MNEKITQLENRIAELESRLNAFDAGYSIPRGFDQSVRERFLGGLIKFEKETDIAATDRHQILTNDPGGTAVPQNFTNLTKVLDPNTGTYKYYPYYT
jgi:hypothetical protein